VHLNGVVYEDRVSRYRGGESQHLFEVGTTLLFEVPKRRYF